MALLAMIHTVFAAVRGYYLQYSTYNELLDFGPLDLIVQDQLRKVYFTLFGALACMSLGYALDLYLNIGGFETAVGFVGVFAWYCLSRKWKEGLRACLLMLAAFLLGVSLYPTIAACLFKIKNIIGGQYDTMILRLIDLFFTIDRSHHLSALIGLTVVFCGFAIMAFPEYIFEGRWVIYGSAFMMSAFYFYLLVWSRIGPEVPGNVKLYVIMGFCFYMVYVMAYSQEMDVQIHFGNIYYTELAIALFTQMPAFANHVIYRFNTRYRTAHLAKRVIELVKGYFLQHAVYGDLTDFEPLTPFVQNQLRMVYLTIFAALACFSLGYALDLYCKIGSSVISVVGFLGIFAWFCLTPRSREGTRVCLLMVAAFLLGASLYHMISYSLLKIEDMILEDLTDVEVTYKEENSMILHLIDLFFEFGQSNISNVFIGVAVVFGSFELIATIIELRIYIYLMSVGISANVLLYWLNSSLASDPDFMKRPPYNVLMPYVLWGFIFLMFYVPAYSQEMVVRIRHGNTSCTQNAIDLFTQMPAFLLHTIYRLFRPRRPRRDDFSNGG